MREKRSGCFVQAAQIFESPTEIVGVDEVGEMLPELIVCFVVVASDCCFFQRPVHQLDLTYASFSSQLCWPEPQAGSAVGPGVLWLGQPMIDVIDGAGILESVSPDRLSSLEGLFDERRG